MISGSLKGCTKAAPVLLQISTAFASLSEWYFPNRTTSAPYSAIASAFSLTAVSGITTVDCFPSRRELYATARPWLPDDAATTFFEASWEILLYAPRILNTRIGWKHSSLRKTSRPRILDSDGDSTKGVSDATPSIRRAAVLISSMVGSVVVSIIGTFTVAL